MANATAMLGAKVAPKKDFAPITDRQMAEAIAEALTPYDRAFVAQKAGRTKEAAKEWKEGRCAPNAASLLNMAMGLPRVRRLVLSALGVEEAGTGSPRDIAARLDAIERVIAAGGTEAAELSRIASGQSDAEALARRAGFAVHDLFDGRRG